MLEKARAGLHRLSAEHFYPVDTSLEQQSEFNNEDREKIDESRRMNIGLADEVTNSTEYALFYARMRTILLEPMRLRIARETSTAETKRLALCLSEDRAHEEEQVAVNKRSKPKTAGGSISVTPKSISRDLNTVDQVAKRLTQRHPAAPSHISIDSEFDIDQN
ncbi:hypothetical protein CAEBREN_07677 [Caenorhabditis brenneri]|uniref:Uncharacterized protein n=1 Tax=Caenorhabditis brenneri TaxID=135651 RepID=G0NUT8_CAEBE|nr:hypothetical protein CAEBREN_07677 [Caenorhabditis brenneri]